MSNAAEPPPVASDRRPAWSLVIEYVEALQRFTVGNPGITPFDPTDFDRLLADMRERDEIGFQKYGVRLQAGNGRRHLVDAYQENLDLIVYLRAWLDERGVSFDLAQITDPSDQAVLAMFADAIARAVLLRSLIERGL